MLAITPGEPAGIGFDLVVQLAAAGLLTQHVVIADADALEARARLMGLSVELVAWTDSSQPLASRSSACLPVQHVPLAKPVQPGSLDPNNAAGVIATLDAALDGIKRGIFGGLVTGPVQKSVINEAGIPFSGHTELLAERAAVDDVVMMLVGGSLRVALATTHLPLRHVADAITPERLRSKLTILHDDLQNKFAIKKPRIVVAGLNPHAGEGGHLGAEDDQIIAPTVAWARQQGMEVVGPLPADTLFTPRVLEQSDAVLAMYHDQGLPVLKYASFGNGVNVTLGLPFVRTSVDHGTALDLAATGQADAGSLQQAIQLAWELTEQPCHAPS